jgi:hypothetical protein
MILRNGDTDCTVVDLRLKSDDTRAETRFRLSAQRTCPFNSAGASVHLTTVRLGVCISSSNAGYTMFQSSVKGIGYPLHPPVSPSLPLPASRFNGTLQATDSMREYIYIYIYIYIYVCVCVCVCV